MAEIINAILREEEEELHFLEEKEEDLLLLAIAEEKRRRWYVRPLNTTRAARGEYSLLVQQMRDMDDERHFLYFRMSSSRFDDLVRRVTPFIQHASTHALPISPEERLALTLRILASGSSQSSVAASYRMGLSTVCSIVSEVTKALWLALREEFVDFPTTQEMTRIASEFWRVWNFPNCVGAIDGKHIDIRAPPRAGSDYKLRHAIILLAVCDARYRFTMVDVGAYGRESDGGASSVPPSKQDSFHCHLHPPCLEHPSKHLTFLLVTLPFLFCLTSHGPFQIAISQKKNKSITIVIHGPGVLLILAARWRILGRPIECHPDKAGDIVKACVALHNYLAFTDADNSPVARYISPTMTDSTTASGDVLQGEWRRIVARDNNLLDPGRLSTSRASHAALAMRKDLCRFFQTPQGLVPWQDNIIHRGRLFS